jgi:Concanavalin A-like lectin/glucanases superfamily
MKNNNKFIFFFFSIIASPFFVSCYQESIDIENNPIPYESIGGFQNSDEIASSNLVTKLSFDNNFNDAKGNITNYIGSNIAYADGVKGNAYSGSNTQDRYAVANASSVITSLNDYTISFWMNSANTIVPATPGQGKGAQGMFAIVRPLEFWGGINLFLENPDAAFPDRIRLKLGVENGRAGVVWRGQSVIMNLDNSLNKWIHVAFTYNATTSKVTGYINGQLATNLSGFAYSPSEGVVGSAPWFADNPGGIDNPNNAPKYGNFEMTGTNGKVVFGTHQFETTPSQNNGGQQDWATSFVGLIDEFRIYNTSLSNNEVRSIYLLEKDNR